jgi:hypothetical protein
MDTLRKLYQRAVCIPLNNVEALWCGLGDESDVFLPDLARFPVRSAFVQGELISLGDGSAYIFRIVGEDEAKVPS